MNLYDEKDHILVKSSHNDYRVFKGTVNWKRKKRGEKDAIVVLMQYGGTEDWGGAQSELALNMPAQILEEGLPAVIEAMSEIA